MVWKGKPIAMFQMVSGVFWDMFGHDKRGKKDKLYKKPWESNGSFLLVLNQDMQVCANYSSTY